MISKKERTSKCLFLSSVVYIILGCVYMWTHVILKIVSLEKRKYKKQKQIKKVFSCNNLKKI